MGCFSGSESKQTSQSYTKDQEKGLAQMIKAYLPSVGQGENIYEGERLAGLSAEQNNLLSQGSSLGNLFSAETSMPLFNETGQALTGLLNGTTGAQRISDDKANEIFQKSYYNPAVKNYKEVVAPSISESYAGPGYWGGARAGAQVKGSQDLADTLSTARGEFDWNVLQQNQALDEARAARSQTAVGQGMQYGQMPTQEALNKLGGLTNTFSFLDVERQQKQAEIDTAIQKFAEENRITNQEDLNILLALLGMNYSSSSGTQSGAGLGYSMASSFASGLGTAMGTP